MERELTPKEREFVERLLKKYTELYVCYGQLYKRLRRKKMALTCLGTLLSIAGVAAGAVTLNPIILGALSGPGAVLLTYMNESKILREVEMSRMARTTYKKVLLRLNAAIDSGVFDRDIVVSDLKVIDDHIADMAPFINGLQSRYRESTGKLV